MIITGVKIEMHLKYKDNFTEIDHVSSRNQDIKRGREAVRYPVGKREYPDFPLSSSPARLTPTDIAPRINGNGRPLPSIGYY